jgi:hypothetical protein
MERPDPQAEAYLYGSHEYRAEVDARPERVEGRRVVEELRLAYEASRCGSPTNDWAPEGHVARCRNQKGSCARHPA